MSPESIDFTLALQALQALGSGHAALEAELAGTSSQMRRSELLAEVDRRSAEIDEAASKVLDLLEDARDRAAWIECPCPFPTSRSPAVQRFFTSVQAAIEGVEGQTLKAMRARPDWPAPRLARIDVERSTLESARERLIPLRERLAAEKTGVERRLAALEGRLRNSPHGATRQKLAAEKEALGADLSYNAAYLRDEVLAPLEAIEARLARLSAEEADLRRDPSGGPAISG